MKLDIFTRLYQLPSTIGAYTVCNPDGSYTIIVNSALNNHRQLLAYAHELQHIHNGDYEKKCSADFIEIQAHRNAPT
jgi:Zn-dependent peptidase ImmA (M78 family)